MDINCSAEGKIANSEITFKDGFISFLTNSVQINKKKTKINHNKIIICKKNIFLKFVNNDLLFI